MTTSDERQQVLRMIADGKITPEEGARLLAALSGGEPLTLAESAASADASTEPTDDLPRPEQADTQQQAYTPEQEVIPPPIEAQLPDTRHWPTMNGKLVGAAKLEVEHFFDCILENKQPLVTGEDGRRSLEVMLAAEQSIAKGGIVMLPL